MGVRVALRRRSRLRKRAGGGRSRRAPGAGPGRAGHRSAGPGSAGHPAGAGSVELGEGILAQEQAWLTRSTASTLLVDARRWPRRLREGFEGLLGLEVGRVIDGGLGPERPLLLEVLLDVGVLVLDVQAGGDPGGDDAGPIAVRGWRGAAGDPLGEQQADAIGATEVEVLADHRLEEVTALDRLVEDLGATDFELPDAQPMFVAGRPVGGRQGPGQMRAPAVEEALHVGRPEAIADRLEPAGSSQARKPLSRL